MTELKTLKDLQKPIRNEEGNCIRVEELRAEAVKWVKKFKRDREDGRFSLHEKQNLYYRELSLIDFFNLTPEDLREEEVGKWEK